MRWGNSDSGIREILAGGIRNPEFKESGIPLTIGRNPSSTDKESVIQHLDYNQYDPTIRQRWRQWKRRWQIDFASFETFSPLFLV